MEVEAGLAVGGTAVSWVCTGLFTALAGACQALPQAMPLRGQRLRRQAAPGRGPRGPSATGTLMVAATAACRSHVTHQLVSERQRVHRSCKTPVKPRPGAGGRGT